MLLDTHQNNVLSCLRVQASPIQQASPTDTRKSYSPANGALKSFIDRRSSRISWLVTSVILRGFHLRAIFGSSWRPSSALSLSQPGKRMIRPEFAADQK